MHDATHAEPSLAFALSRVTQATHGGTPVGIFRNIERPVYDDLMAEQLRGGRGEEGQGRPRGATPLRRDLGRQVAAKRARALLMTALDGVSVIDPPADWYVVRRYDASRSGGGAGREQQAWARG